jgi:hypothetical protein
MLSLRWAKDPLQAAAGDLAGVKEEMVLAASSYPLLWVLWIWIVIWVFIDIFRSQDLPGWAKALWFLFVPLIPLIGVLVYLIARGGSMHKRAAGDAHR